jgi:hypothetical protein
MAVLFPFFISFQSRSPFRQELRIPSSQQKSRSPETRICCASSERRRCRSARRWTSGAPIWAHRSCFPLQVACQLGGAEKTVWNQSKNLNCRVLRQGVLLPFAASQSKTCRFIVQCEKIGNR